MYNVSVQMIEIYNEQVRDLLVADGSNKRYPFQIQYLVNYLISFFNEVQGSQHTCTTCI